MIFGIKIDLPILSVDIIGIYIFNGSLGTFSKKLECYVIMYAKKKNSW